MDALPGSLIADGFWGAVGRTPLIRLKRASEATGCEILGKAEFMNPGGSVKDRAALGILQDAVARGALTPGKPGDRAIIAGSVTNDAAKELFPQGWDAPKPYIRWVEVK